METKKVWSAMFAALVRHACTGIGGYLLAHGLVTSDQSAALQDKVMGAVALAVPMVWSWWQKITSSLEAEARAQLPETATVFEVRQRMATLGYRHVLWTVHSALADPRYDEIRSDVLALKAQLVELQKRLDALAQKP